MQGADLIIAQQALQAGDDGLDRAMLARLTTDGLDGSRAPLFPDLDRLTALLGCQVGAAVQIELLDPGQAVSGGTAKGIPHGQSAFDGLPVLQILGPEH